MFLKSFVLGVFVHRAAGNGLLSYFVFLTFFRRSSYLPSAVPLSTGVPKRQFRFPIWIAPLQTGFPPLQYFFWKQGAAGPSSMHLFPGWDTLRENPARGFFMSSGGRLFSLPLIAHLLNFEDLSQDAEGWPAACRPATFSFRLS